MLQFLFSLHSSDPVQAAHSDQVIVCSVPPSAQGLFQGHTHSDGVRRVEGRVGSVEVRVMRVEVRVRRTEVRV